MMLSRRGLILGIGAALAAPAIVRAENIMKVRALPPLSSKAELVALIERKLKFYSDQFFDAYAHDLIEGPTYVVKNGCFVPKYRTGLLGELIT